MADPERDRHDLFEGLRATVNGGLGQCWALRAFLDRSCGAIMKNERKKCKGAKSARPQWIWVTRMAWRLELVFAATRPLAPKPSSLVRKK